MTQKTSISKDPTSANAYYRREGDEIAFTIRVNGTTTGVTDPTMAMYKEGSTSDLSGTYLTGSMSVAGVDTIITKKTQNLKAGNYIISVNATVDGQVMNVVTIPFIVKRRSER